jgi:photosystem II stability/assembly factor-like uncharacterized protein
MIRSVRTVAMTALTAAAVLVPAPVFASGSPAVSPLFHAASISWTSPQQGWVLGAAPCGGKTCTDVIGTTDGGGAWAVLSKVPAAIPVFGKPTSNIVTELRLATPQVGWAFAPDLYLTTTGGRSWTRQPVPGGGKQILALAASATTAYAVVSPCVFGQGDCGKPLSLWRASTHAASSWHKVTLDLPSNFTAQVVVSGTTVYVVDPQTGHDLFYASTDNGQHFATRPVPCDRKLDTGLAWVAATSATRVDLLCVGNPGLGKATKTVYRSADTGKTDSYAGILGPFGITCQLAASRSGNLAVACVSAPGSFLYVNDSGKKSWRMVVGYGDGGAGWDDIGYLNDVQGSVVYAPYSFIGGVGKIFVTHDGGRHWNFVTL